MTHTIEEGNRLILFFDGAENVEIDVVGEPVKAIKYKDEYYHPERNLPDFHKDWNLLMEVVEKIEAMGDYVIIKRGAGTIKYCRIEKGKEKPADALSRNSKIEAVWNAAIEFIQWHNQYTQTKK